jgi:hypothetical protein
VNSVWISVVKWKLWLLPSLPQPWSSIGKKALLSKVEQAGHHLGQRDVDGEGDVDVRGVVEPLRVGARSGGLGGRAGRGVDRLLVGAELDLHEALHAEVAGVVLEVGVVDPEVADRRL